ncbi:MAG: MCE family protein [Planctomycetes bacterium]|nr:MCE family protein [Planctomycetota bacterium]
MEETRSELWAGIVIILAVVIVVTMIMKVGKFVDIEPRQEIAVYLSRVQGIKPNDPVRYAGMEVGKVTSVEYDQEKQKVRLGMSILKDKVIREDSTATVAVTMMGIASVEIFPGDGDAVEKTQGPIEVKGVETATLQDVADKAGALLDNLSQMLGEEQRKQFQEILLHIRDASQNAKNAFGKINNIVEENRAGVRSTVEHIDKAVKGIHQIVTENKDNIAATIKNIKRASGRLDSLFNQLDEGIKDIRAAVAEAKKFVGTANLVLDENRKPINDALRNAKDITANLLILSADIRRHPWKLLNRPTEMEVLAGDIASAPDRLKALIRDLDGQTDKLMEMIKLRSGDAKIQQMVDDLKDTIELMQKNQEELKRRAAEPIKKP